MQLRYSFVHTAFLNMLVTRYFLNCLFVQHYAQGPTFAVLDHFQILITPTRLYISFQKSVAYLYCLHVVVNCANCFKILSFVTLYISVFMHPSIAPPPFPFCSKPIEPAVHLQLCFHFSVKIIECWLGHFETL